MTNNHSESNRPHPTIGELLSLVEGDLDQLQTKPLEDHVANCEKCRQECAAMSKGMERFAALVRAARLPDPPAATFLEAPANKSAVAARDRRHPVPALAHGLAALSWKRVAFVGLAAAALVIGAVLFQASQPSARASQFLTRSIAASDSIERSNKVLRQRVRVRQGSRVLERGVFRGLKYQVGDEQLRDAALEQTLRRAAVDWDDPLNPRDFARWRDAQEGGSDSLSETAGSVTITTATRDAMISAASLTLATSDWHPVARRVDLREQPAVEITEIGSELLDAANLTNRMPPETAIADAERGPSAFQLEESELRLRETLSFLGMDATAAPEIWRGKDGVHYRAYPASPEEANKLRAEVRNIPFVAEARTNPSPHSRAESPVNREFESGAPYADALEKGLGGLEQANQYLVSIQEQYQRALAQSAVLSNLSARYPAGYSMPDPLETRLEALVTEHVGGERRELLAYLQSVSIGLKLLGAGDMQELAQPATCSQWQEQARLIAAELHDLHLNFMRLFVADKSETAAADTPDSRLARCERLRTSLARHVASLCAPGK